MCEERENFISHNKGRVSKQGWKIWNWKTASVKIFINISVFIFCSVRRSMMNHMYEMPEKGTRTFLTIVFSSDLCCSHHLIGDRFKSWCIRPSTDLPGVNIGFWCQIRRRCSAWSARSASHFPILLFFNRSHISSNTVSISYQFASGFMNTCFSRSG